MTKPLLEVKNLTVQLDGQKIIDNLSFQVSDGEVLTILGPNGAGKSVLVKTLLGLLPYKGEIVWNQKLRVGYLPQGLNQLMMKNLPLTVIDFFVIKNPILTLREIIDFLNLVGLEPDVVSQNAGDLSGGQFQRVLIAWVLISHPEVIFFDEPMRGIDIGGGDTVYSLLQDIKKIQKLTIFLVTHDLHIIYEYSTNVLCLSRKKYSCYGRPKEILSPKMLEETFGMKIKYYDHIK